MATSSAPFTADALNRFRMTHSDREVRSLVKRLNRLPVLPADDDQPLEEQAARLEVDKWQFGVERHLASVRNLERQARSYESRAAQTRSRNDELKATLEEEKKLLAQGMAERDQRIKCDEVAKRIQARGRTRAELEEQISTIEASIVEHRANYDAVLAVANERAVMLAKITTLVDAARELKLPTWAGGDEAEVEEAAEAPKPALSATSLPFQPATPASRGPAASAPVSRSGSASPHAQPHHLPQRPGNSASPRYASGGRGALPTRPSGLRHAAKPGNGGGSGSLEDGEVGEEEKRGSKRKAEERPERSSRRK